uniref:Hcy-binding domain-containing protein n=1 Tax=Timema tahoe TaxID=61484 RepID=A0A7R9ICM5_9NEOP|nr:unnamed protein product [Timema tahoe]
MSPSRTNNITVLDGGFATQLCCHVTEPIDGNPLWSASFLATDPQSVVNTHLDFLRAGADAVMTNTYQASVDGFMAHLGLSREKSYNLIKKAVELANEAINIYMEESNPGVALGIGLTSYDETAPIAAKLVPAIATELPGVKELFRLLRCCAQRCLHFLSERDDRTLQRSKSPHQRRCPRQRPDLCTRPRVPTGAPHIMRLSSKRTRGKTHTGGGALPLAQIIPTCVTSSPEM